VDFADTSFLDFIEKQVDDDLEPCFSPPSFYVVQVGAITSYGMAAAEKYDAGLYPASFLFFNIFQFV
jgi:hypothetical protein